jgi:hypothetical protein
VVSPSGGYQGSNPGGISEQPQGLSVPALFLLLAGNGSHP